MHGARLTASAMTENLRRYLPLLSFASLIILIVIAYAVESNARKSSARQRSPHLPNGRGSLSRNGLKKNREVFKVSRNRNSPRLQRGENAKEIQRAQRRNMRVAKLKGDTGLRNDAVPTRLGQSKTGEKRRDQLHLMIGQNQRKSKQQSKRRYPAKATAKIDQQSAYRESQRVALDCGSGRFISQVHVTYAADISKSVYFAYQFIFRRPTIVLPADPSQVVRYSCHALKYCMGRRACLFQVSNMLCMHDPTPTKRKVLVVKMACQDVKTFNGSLVKRTMLAKLHHTVGLIKVLPAGPREFVISEGNVFGASCPAIGSAEVMQRYAGKCESEPPSAATVRAELWTVLGRVTSPSCREEIIETYCAYQYDKHGACIPRRLVHPNPKLVQGAPNRHEARFANKRSAEREEGQEKNPYDPLAEWKFGSLPHLGSRPKLRVKPASHGAKAALTPARLAFAIIMHKEPAVVLQLLRSVFHPGHFYAIHIDQREDAVRKEMWSMVKEAFWSNGYRNVHVLPKDRSFVSTWGSYGIVRAQLEAIEELLRMGLWDFAITMSGEDMALRTVDDIAATLASHKGRNFFRVTREWDQHPRKSDQRVWFQCSDEEFEFNVTARRLPSEKLHSSSHWPTLSREFAKFVVQRDRGSAVNQLQYFLQTTLIPDENYLINILGKSSLNTSLHPNSLYATKTYEVGSDVNLCHHSDVVDTCGQGPGIYTETDLPLLRRLSFDTIFARKFDSQLNSEVRRLVDMWAKFGLQRHVEKNYAGMLSARQMAALSAEHLLGQNWMAKGSIVRVDQWKVLPRLEPRSKCCQSSGHIQSGLMGEVRYWVDFTLKMAKNSQQRKVRASLTHLPRAQCFPKGHVSALLMGTRFLVRNGKHYPWTSVLPAPWDHAGNTSVWVLAVLQAGQSASQSCSEKEHELERAWWHSHMPHSHAHLNEKDSSHLKQVAKNSQTGDKSKAKEDSQLLENNWFKFSRPNTTEHFSVHLIDPSGKLRCKKAFPVTWRKQEIPSWQSWRFFSCGMLEPGLWTARLMSPSQPEQPLYETHAYLVDPKDALNEKKDQLHHLWTVEHAAFIEGSRSFGKDKPTDTAGVVLPLKQYGVYPKNHVRTRKLKELPRRGRKHKAKPKAGNRSTHKKKHRPGGGKLTTFERWFNFMLGFLVRYLLVVGVLYLVLTKLINVKVKGKYTLWHGIVLASLFLVGLQALLYNRLP